MKVGAPAAHPFEMARRPAMHRPRIVEEHGDEVPPFEALYQSWFGEVWRWLRALGGLESDLEDLAQEVFVVVRRKLPEFDGRHLASWLYRIAARTASDHRRRSWFRHLVARRDDAELDALRNMGPSPAELFEQREERRVLWHLLSRMNEPRRVAFALFEIEGYTGEEIAALLGIPVATVWTRLHYARRDFVALVADYQRKEGR